MAASPLEVVDWNSRRSKSLVKALARDVLTNREPGFQIDGVSNTAQLYSVFDVIKLVMPAEDRKVFQFNSYQKGLQPPKNGVSTTAPHIDAVEGPRGLAVHQNIRGSGKLLLAHAIGDEYKRGTTRSAFEPDYDQLEETRTGTLEDGRITVFSEGGYGMRPALHFFDRRGQDGLDRWVRYSYSPDLQIETDTLVSDDVKYLAQIAFALSDQTAVAA